MLQTTLMLLVVSGSVSVQLGDAISGDQPDAVISLDPSEPPGLLEPPAGYEVVRTTTYLYALRAFQERCRYADDAVLIGIGQAMQADLEEGVSLGAMLVHAWTWCKDNGYGSKYDHCIPSLGSLVELTQYQRKPPPQPAELDEPASKTEASPEPTVIARPARRYRTTRRPPVGSQRSNEGWDKDTSGGGFWSYLPVCALIYFTPTVIAFCRRLNGRQKIWNVNRRWGWTGIGWFVALGMSLTATGKRQERDRRRARVTPVSHTKGPEWDEARAEGCESPQELRLLRAIQADGTLPEPDKQYKVYEGRRLLTRADFAYLDCDPKVLIYVDGLKWHSDVEQRTRDNRITNKLQSMQYRVLRFLGTETHHTPEACVAQIKEARRD